MPNPVLTDNVDGSFSGTETSLDNDRSIDTALRPPLSTHQHVAVLDGARGAAAICVLLFHGLSPQLFTNGFLMVDLFFLLSGFVIAYSYEQKLLSGYPFRTFLVRRISRLYPMVFIGAIFSFFVYAGIGVAKHSLDLSSRESLLTTLLSFGPIPFLLGNTGDRLFPHNTVLWSLFLELIVNIVYAGLVKQLTSRVLMVAVVASLVAIAYWGIGGESVNGFLLGLPRVCAGFFGGILLFRASRARPTPRLSIGLVPICLIVLAISLFPEEISGIGFLPVYALFALLVLGASNAVVGPRESDICVRLGAASYPMYVLHKPIMAALVLGSRRIFHGSMPMLVGAVVTACVLLFICSLLIVRYYETPARAWILRRLSGRAVNLFQH